MNFSFWNICAAFFIIVAARYFIFAGLFQLWFYNLKKEKWTHRKLGKKSPDRQQFYKEIKWSLVTSLIFAFTGAVTFLLWQNGNTRIYTAIHLYPLWYLPFSLLLSMLIHETYYYWLHRWMHRPAVFKILHKVHHDSNTTSAWTAFSFHPAEGLLQALILPLTILLLPMHVYIILVQLTLMTFSSIINHLEIEIYPPGFHKHIIGRWLIGATHHSIHHKQFRYNFGLYFTFWDKWTKTESPKFNSIFEEKTLPKI